MSVLLLMALLAQDPTVWRVSPEGSDATGARRLKVYDKKVYDNVIRECHDTLEPTGGEIEAEWNDNLLENALIGVRIKDVKAGPCYIYWNRFFSGGEGSCSPRDINFFAGSDGAVFVYHHSFASRRGLVLGSTTPERGAPSTWFLNNVFSNEFFWTTSPKWTFNAQAHASWCGGDARQYPWMADSNVIATGQRLWDPQKPSFLLAEDSPARSKGVDLSKPVTLDGKTFGPRPGMSPGYFSGERPDLGAVQFKSK